MFGRRRDYLSVQDRQIVVIAWSKRGVASSDPSRACNPLVAKTVISGLLLASFPFRHIDSDRHGLCYLAAVAPYDGDRVGHPYKSAIPSDVSFLDVEATAGLHHPMELREVPG